MTPVIAIVLVCGFVGWLIWLETVRWKKVVANLAALAARLGLELIVVRQVVGLHRAHVEGRLQGKVVRFWSYTTGSGRSQRLESLAPTLPDLADVVEFCAGQR
jgi:hypothetical protein